MYTPIVKVVIFSVAGKEYALDIQDVVSIERVPLIRPLPSANPSLVGVMELRSTIIPVIDLRILFQAPLEETVQKDRRIIVLKNGDKTVGCLVDVANNIVDITRSAIQTIVHGTGTARQVLTLEGTIVPIVTVAELIQEKRV